MIGARLSLRRKLPLMLGVIGALGAAAFIAVVLLANHQVFNRLLPESRALQDLEARTAQLLQGYYGFMLTPDLVDEAGFVDSLAFIRQRLQGYQQLVAGQPELETLAERIGVSVDVLEQSGDNMLAAYHENQQILGRTQQLEIDIDTIFRQYLAEVSRDIAVAIEQREIDRLGNDLIPELRMVKSVNQLFLELQLEIREYQIHPKDAALDEIAALRERILFSNTMFELWVENSVERAAISGEILQYFGELGDVIERFTDARSRAEFALSRAEQAGLDLHQSIKAAMAYTETRGWSGLQESMYILAAVLFATLLTSYLFIMIGVDRALRPLGRLRASIAQFGEGNLRQRAEVRRDDEIGQLAQAFNGMADQIESKTQQEQQLIRQLESKNAELERFSYTVSHELKSPLVTMSGFIGHLQKDLADGNEDRARFDMDRVTEAVETMGLQLDDLLELSRVGHTANPPTRVSIRDLCLKQMQSMEALIESRDALIELGDDMPDAWADEARIGEAIRNLIENGIKFTPAGRQPYLRVSAEVKNGQLLCRVQDNGIGIEPRFHDKVFGLFDRLDNSVPGTGIGLAMVRRIIETHDGKIWIDSQPDGQGSCFCFTLPLAQGG